MDEATEITADGETIRRTFAEVNGPPRPAWEPLRAPETSPPSAPDQEPPSRLTGAEDSDPGPSAPPETITFETREAFLVERDRLTAQIERRLADDVDGSFERTLLAENYATAVELRLALVELGSFLETGRRFMESGPGRFLGRLPRKQRREIEQMIDEEAGP